METYSNLKQTYADWKQSVIDRLPKVKESGIWKNDPAVYSFIHLIMQHEHGNGQQGKRDLMSVIDQILMYYAPLGAEQQNLLRVYQSMCPTPHDLKKLVTFYLERQVTESVVNKTDASGNNPTEEQEKEKTSDTQ